MNVDDYLESLDELTEQYIYAADYPVEPFSDEGAQRFTEAVNASADSLAFCKTMFDNFKLNGMLPEDASFDLSYMENLIDALVGEISAAVLYLKGQPPGRNVIQGLRKISADIHEHNSLAKEEDHVPHVVGAGFSRLADRIESTKVNVPPDIV